MLSGRGGTFADITLTRTATVVPMHLAEVKDEEGNQRFADGWSWSGCGAVRGFLLRPLAGDPLGGAGAVDFAELRYGSASGLPVDGGDAPRAPIPLDGRHLDQAKNRGQTVADDTAVTLRAGRYRAFLLGNGTCQVRVPLGGYGRTVRANATTAAAMVAKVSELRPVGQPSLPDVPLPRLLVAKVPLTVRSNTFAVTLVHRVSYEVVPSTVNYGTCVEADPGETCARATPLTPIGKYGDYHRSSGAQPPSSSALPVPAWAGVSQIGTWYAPGWIPPGPAFAKVSVEADQSTSLQAVTFALDL